MSITVRDLTTQSGNVSKLVSAALQEGGGILRLAPCWVPRSFLQPGRRLRLHPDDLYAYGLDRGGIDERWLASTIPAANEGRVHDEGYSYVVARGDTYRLTACIKSIDTNTSALPIIRNVPKIARWFRSVSASLMT